MLRMNRADIGQPAVHESAATRAGSVPEPPQPAETTTDRLTLSNMPDDIIHHLAGKLDNIALNQLLSTSRGLRGLGQTPGPIEQRRRTTITLRKLSSRIPNLDSEAIGTLADHLPSPLPERIQTSLAQMFNQQSSSPADSFWWVTQDQKIVKLLPVLERPDIDPGIISQAWQTITNIPNIAARGNALGNGARLWYKHFPDDFFAQLHALAPTAGLDIYDSSVERTVQRCGSVYESFSDDHKKSFKQIIQGMPPAAKSTAASGLFASWKTLDEVDRKFTLDNAVARMSDDAIKACIPIFCELSRPWQTKIITEYASANGPVGRLMGAASFLPLWPQLTPKQQAALLPHFKVGLLSHPAFDIQVLFGLENALRQSPDANLEKLLQPFGEALQSWSPAALSVSPSQMKQRDAEAQLTTLANFRRSNDGYSKAITLARLTPELSTLAPAVRRKILETAFSLSDATGRLQASKALVEGMRSVPDSEAQADIAAALASANAQNRTV